MLIATICALVLGGKFLSASVRTALSVTGGEAALWWSFAAVSLGVCAFLVLEAMRCVRQIRNR
ncbi:MAG: hypothetical protein SF002_05005 [Alphaproteobacteria bacterium]|nr:hypothetical protein [Alphaproteobacteria bacterium]